MLSFPREFMIYYSVVKQLRIRALGKKPDPFSRSLHFIMCKIGIVIVPPTSSC